MNSLFSDDKLFSAYSTEHYTVLILGVLVSIALFYLTKNWTYLKQRKILIIIAIVLSVLQLLKVPITMALGTFDMKEHLPFHLCNFLPFFLVYVFYYLSRKLWAAIFFWIILGCSQANFTPVIETCLFNWDAIRYWVIHVFLVTLALYPLFIWKWEIKHADVWRNILALNIVALVVYIVNLITGGNYMYLNAKPPGTTLYSSMPEWPYYILVIEGILVVWSYMLWGLYKLILGLSPKKKK